jgi:hypothetical protein
VCVEETVRGQRPGFAGERESCVREKRRKRKRETGEEKERENRNTGQAKARQKRNIHPTS